MQKFALLHKMIIFGEKLSERLGEKQAPREGLNNTRREHDFECLTFSKLLKGVSEAN
jgi:hypothetical protein